MMLSGVKSEGTLNLQLPFASLIASLPSAAMMGNRTPMATSMTSSALSFFTGNQSVEHAELADRIKDF